MIGPTDSPEHLFRSALTLDAYINVQIAPCKRIHEGPGFRNPVSGFQIPAFWIPESIP